MMNNLDIDTVMFINEVQKRPLLWDSTNPDYGKPNCRQQCWDEITNLFFNIEDEAETEKYTFGLMLQKRWKNLRGCFTRELLRQKAPCNPDRMKRKNHYIYYPNLLFLKSVVTNKSIDVCDDSSYPDGQDNYTNETLSLVKLEYEPPSVSPSLPRYEDEAPKKRFKQETKGEDPVVTTSAECESSVQQTCRKKKLKTATEREAYEDPSTSAAEDRDDASDSERLFLLSLVGPLKMVPIGERLAVQMEILNVINEAIHK